MRLLQPSVTISGFATASADFSDVENSDYKASTTSLFATIPLTGVRLRPDRRVIAWQPMLTFGAATTSQGFELVDRDPRLYSGLLNGSVMWASSRPNVYYVSLGASFAEDEDTVKDDPEPRLSALFLGTLHLSRRFAFLYGGAYTHVYGRGLPLPAIGLVWHPNETWSLYGLLPFLWSLSQKFNEQLTLNYLVWASGQQFGFENDGLFPIDDDKVYERVREQHLGVELEWRPVPNVSVLSQAGVAMARHMVFTPVDSVGDKLLDEAIDPAPYARLALHIRLGRSVLDELQRKDVRSP